jgi:hypothetical protein
VNIFRDWEVLGDCQGTSRCCYSLEGLADKRLQAGPLCGGQVCTGPFPGVP